MVEASCERTKAVLPVTGPCALPGLEALHDPEPLEHQAGVVVYREIVRDRVSQRMSRRCIGQCLVCKDAFGGRLRDETAGDRLALGAELGEARIVGPQTRLLTLDRGQTFGIGRDVLGRRAQVVLQLGHVSLLRTGPPSPRPNGHLDRRTRW